jgi:exopolysaccharide biosynthesis protein
MKRTALILSAFLSLALVCGSCTKPDAGSENDQQTPPVVQDKEEEDEPEPEQKPAPILESISTSFGNKAVYGEKLIVTGQNFSDQPGGNVLLFDEVSHTQFEEVGPTRLVAVIPEIISKESVLVRVSTAAGTSEPLSLEFDLRRCDSSLVFKGAKVEELRPGVKWISTITQWQGEPRSINIVTVPKSEIKNLHLTYPSGKVKTSEQCKSADALVGINGQYFDNSSGGTGLARDFLKIDGAVATQGADGRSSTFASGAFVFTDGAADVIRVSKNEGARSLADKNVMVCGPLLIENGKYTSLDLSTTHNTDTHPRTAVAVTENGNVLLVTIDGRFPGQAVGMPTPLMQEFFTLLGAKSVLNLDGGGSTTMYIKGKGMVNHGSDGSNWDKPTERKVNSIIYLK